MSDLPPPIIYKQCSDRRFACQTGYFCGPYGCAKQRRSRISAAKTMQVSGNEGEFRECCERNQLPDGCLNYCSYSKYPQISSLFSFPSISCPIQTLPIIHNCATRQRNHQKCCEDTKLIPENCLEFCAPLKELGQLDVSKIDCFNYLTTFRDCFYYGYYG
ncbi:unnamed protein product [Caenorhabditis angaria]|uniref:Domain of unknown function DB domain-containing protein n=1 Tax=Caenorhabditis angaria TaxID=860376 RepID=A0A9P1N2J6_9PELO|nr:unnamed protein product [Caenorhabditis angaria]